MRHEAGLVTIALTRMIFFSQGNIMQENLRQSVAVLAAGAACIELYSVFETLLSCSFGLSFDEAKHSALWLCLFIGVSLRLPAAYGLYYHNTLFKPQREYAVKNKTQ